MGMFDLNDKKKLTIVHTDDTTEYANYFQQMMNATDDLENEVIGVKDNSVETVVWSEKQYFEQKPKLSGDSYILFIGISKKLESECFGAQEKFNQYGMKYSWFGRKAYLCVEDSVKRKEYDSFLKFAQQYQADAKRAMDTKKQTLKKDATAAGVGVAVEAAATAVGAASLTSLSVPVIFAAPLFAPIGAIAGGLFIGHKIKDKIQERKKVNNQQYCCLLLKFYMDGIGKFLAQE